MGFAAGFQVGAQAVERGIKLRDEENQRKEFERIQNAQAESIQQGYTPQMGQQLEAIANAKDAQGNAAYQLTPQEGGTGYGLSVRNEQGEYVPVEGPGIQPQRVTQFLGQRYEGDLTPERMQGLRYSAMADVVAKQDPVRAFQMRQEAARMEREAEEAPLRLQGLRQQTELGGIQLGEAQRKAEVTGRMDAFNTEFNQLQNPTPDQIKTLAAKHNLDRAQQLDVTSQITGIAKNELDAFDLDIKKAVKGKDLSGLIDLHKNDPRFGDGTHFVMAKGDKGQVVLNLVSDADPTKVLRTESFKDSMLATAYLRKAAEDPANLAEWMIGMRGKEADITAKTASAAKDVAMGNYYTARGGLENRPQAANFREFVDNKGQSVMVDVTKLPQKNGVIEMPAGLRPKTMAGRELSDADKIKLDTLYKSDAWQAAERKGDVAQMNQLLIGRGLNPETIGVSGVPSWGSAAAPAAPAARTPATQQGLGKTEPQGREEFALADRARSQGFYPVGRGNAVFGAGELLFEDNRGNRLWASQIK